MTEALLIKKRAGVAMMVLGGIPLACCLLLCLVLSLLVVACSLPIVIQYLLITSLIIAGGFYLKKRSRLVAGSFVVLTATFIGWSAIDHLEGRNVLEKYGVSFEENNNRVFDAMWINLDRNGKRIPCVEFYGDVFVRFRSADKGIPQIVVRSSDEKNNYAVLRLNLTDATRPEFELVENHKMLIAYAYPWSDFYRSKTDERTNFAELEANLK